MHVSTITKPGVEPHDLELTPKDLVDLPKMSLVVYLKGFQPAIDAAVAQQAPTTAYDVSTAADLTLNAPEGESGTTATDPHFWLDPIRYAAVATAVGERLALADPPHAADYRARAATFRRFDGRIGQEVLDRSGLMCHQETCHRPRGVRLPGRALWPQPGGQGLSPDQEPSAKQLADVATAVKASGVTTIFTETLVEHRSSPRPSPRKTGVTLALLDKPVEGITDQSPGKDYHAVMVANLAALRTGLGCS